MRYVNVSVIDYKRLKLIEKKLNKLNRVIKHRKTLNGKYISIKIIEELVQ